METERVDAARLRGRGRERDDLFNDMYATYARRVRALAESRLRGRGLADDVVQETFLRVHRNLDRFDTTLPAWPWLKMIATNVCTDVLRCRQGSMEQPVDDAGLSELPGGEAPGDAYLAKERRLGIATVLAGMNPRQRRALVLTGVEGWRAEQVADLEGSSVTAVRATLKRGRQAFRSSYLTLAAERGLLGAVAVLGAARTVLRRVRGAASAGGNAAVALGPLQLASAAFVGLALVGGLVAVGPWSLAMGSVEHIAETGSLPAAGSGSGSAPSASAPSDVAPAAAAGPGVAAPAPVAAVAVTVPETGAATKVAATAAIDDSERSSLVARVEGSLSDGEAVEAPSINTIWADLYCDYSELRRAACAAAADVLAAP